MRRLIIATALAALAGAAHADEQCFEISRPGGASVTHSAGVIKIDRCTGKTWVWYQGLWQEMFHGVRQNDTGKAIILPPNFPFDQLPPTTPVKPSKP